jgi:DNA-directed RNA polymerase subunit RPC12/RpoP
MELTIPTIERMYLGGPLRLFAAKPFLGAVPCRGGDLNGYAGKYICALCREPVPEIVVAAGQWVCKRCSHAKTKVSTTTPAARDGTLV